MLDTLIRGGTIVSDGVAFVGDIGIDHGKIAGLWLSADSSVLAQHIIDASSKIVMPGAIDAHFHTQTGATYFQTRADTMETATISAALGGITTVLPFVWGDPGQTIEDFLSAFLKLAGSLAVCDFSAHCGLVADMNIIRRIPDAFGMGVTSFKFHYGYRKSGLGRMSDDDHRLAALEIIGRLGGIGMFHCENGYIIDYLENKFADAGMVSREYHLKSRPNLAEAEAINRTIVLSELSRCPVYVVHLSTAEGLEEISQAQARGAPVFTETCPQYLSLTDTALERWGVLAKVAPPLRQQADVEAMWRGVQSGQIDVIGSDHSAQSRSHKESTGNNFLSAPFGTPIVEVMLPIVFTEGVCKGKISVEKFVSLFTEGPARRFGLYPQKGSLRPGADADVLIWDPEAKWTIEAAQLSNPCGYNIFDGWKVRGRPWRSWLRGQPLLTEGKIVLHAGAGKFIRCGPPAESLTAPTERRSLAV